MTPSLIFYSIFSARDRRLNLTMNTNECPLKSSGVILTKKVKICEIQCRSQYWCVVIVCVPYSTFGVV